MAETKEKTRLDIRNGYLSHSYPFWLSFVVYLIIFTMDVSFENEYGIGKFYVGTAFLYFFMRSARDIVTVAVVGILLMGVGYAFSPESPAQGPRELLGNRLFAALIICFGAWLAILYRTSITALQRSETALREAHSLAHLGHFVLRFNQAETLSCSDETLRISGMQSDRGLSLRDVLTQVVHPEDRRRVLKGIREDLARSGRYELEFRIIRPDGDVRDVRSAGHIENGRAGTHGRLIGTLLDVSEWRRTERALRESEARMQSVLDSVFDALIMLNQQGEIETFSSSAETSRSAA
jgi:PAS domain S-box-containing protein